MPNKQEILLEVNSAHPDLAHQVAAKHNGVLLDLKCNVCANPIKRHWVEIPKHPDAKLEDEYRYVVCPQCGVAGRFSHKVSEAPTAAEVAKARKQEILKQINSHEERILAKKEQISNLEKEIESLEDSVDALSKQKA